MKADMLAELANLFAYEAEATRDLTEAERLFGISEELFNACLRADIREGYFDEAGR